MLLPVLLRQIFLPVLLLRFLPKQIPYYFGYGRCGEVARARVICYFSPIGLNKPVRVQGAFVSDAELNKIVDFIVKQSIPVNYSEEVTSQELACDSKSNTQEDTGNFSPAEDELFEDAVNLVLDMGQASSSMLQRRFRIGYTRAKHVWLIQWRN